ncbi:hypothetical protein [Methylocystis parvus]|uniref:hypothetical protein n=1 Tax=Methylocystis parvus TaxID=134 RepID=UPI003C78FFBC
MARTNSYLFCRYQILIDGVPLTADGEWETFEELVGRPIAYRKRDPKPDDADTYMLKTRQKTVGKYRIHTWEIAQDIKYRERSRYRKSDDEIVNEVVATDEMKHTKFVAIPRLGVFAVSDNVSERSLGARAAVNRFKAILETSDEECDVIINFAGSPQDAARALETWELDQFSFTVRPFNPHPMKLGETLSEMIKSDNIASVRGLALPNEGQKMQDSSKGLISEARGLADAGYGQYGAKGTTPDGLKASIAKPKFSLDKTKNSEAQARNRVLKVYIDKGEAEEDEERAIVKALIDLYERPEE